MPPWYPRIGVYFEQIYRFLTIKKNMINDWHWQWQPNTRGEYSPPPPLKIIFSPDVIYACENSFLNGVFPELGKKKLFKGKIMNFWVKSIKKE